LGLEYQDLGSLFALLENHVITETRRQFEYLSRRGIFSSESDNCEAANKRRVMKGAVFNDGLSADMSCE
jgi:hypothetical protein